MAKRSSDRMIGAFLSALIITNLIAVILHTVKDLYAHYHIYFDTFEAISVMIFSVELAIRIWIVPEGEDKRPIMSRIKFLFTPMAIVDILAILPFYLPLFVEVDLLYLRALRLMRIFRIFKLGRYSKSLQLLSRVVQERSGRSYRGFFGGLGMCHSGFDLHVLL